MKLQMEETYFRHFLSTALLALELEDWEQVEHWLRQAIGEAQIAAETGALRSVERVEQAR